MKSWVWVWTRKRDLYDLKSNYFFKRQIFAYQVLAETEEFVLQQLMASSANALKRFEETCVNFLQLDLFQVTSIFIFKPF